MATTRRDFLTAAAATAGAAMTPDLSQAHQHEHDHQAVPSDPALRVKPKLPRDEGGPVFAEPWQAQAFALAVRLSEQGHFTYQEWAAALAEELKSATDRGEPDDARIIMNTGSQ